MIETPQPLKLGNEERRGLRSMGADAEAEYQDVLVNRTHGKRKQLIVGRRIRDVPFIGVQECTAHGVRTFCPRSVMRRVH